jgi:hypothetical protein
MQRLLQSKFVAFEARQVASRMVATILYCGSAQTRFFFTGIYFGCHYCRSGKEETKRHPHHHGSVFSVTWKAKQTAASCI